MAINPTVTRTDDGSWLFTWSPGTSPYSIWLEGVELVSGLTTESFTYEDGDGSWSVEPPPIEILNDGDTSENDTYPPVFRIQWTGVLSADNYTIENYTGGAWVSKGARLEDGSGTYSFTTQPLTDGNSEQWRVMAQDLFGGDGTPIAFTFEVVRNPAPPTISAIDINSSGDLEVS